MNRILADQTIYEDQNFAAPRQLGMFGLDLEKRRAEYKQSVGKNHEHEFQELGEQLEKFYGKRIWAVFHEPKGTEANVRKAHSACVRYGKIGNFAYFKGVLKKL